jgi:hypothetical protein
MSDRDTALGHGNMLLLFETGLRWGQSANRSTLIVLSANLARFQGAILIDSLN